MLDFSISEINTELPSLWTMLYAIMVCLVLVSLLAFTYEKTTSKAKVNFLFIQAMILGSITTCIIIQAIGDSVGRGLGMLGALAVIRFRNNITQPRNIIFVFMAIGIGICCGVYGINLAIIGTIFYCLTAFLLRYSPLNNDTEKQFTLRLNLEQNSLTSQQDLETIILQHSRLMQLNRLEILDEKESNRKEFNYLITPKSQDIAKDFIDELSALNGVSRIRYNAQDENSTLL